MLQRFRLRALRTELPDARRPVPRGPRSTPVTRTGFCWAAIQADARFLETQLRSSFEAASDESVSCSTGRSGLSSSGEIRPVSSILPPVPPSAIHRAPPVATSFSETSQPKKPHPPERTVGRHEIAASIGSAR